MGKRIDADVLRELYEIVGTDNLEKSGFDREQLEEYIVMGDPVAWCKKYLRDPQHPNKPIEIRWYQEEILRCDNTLRAVRIGRQAGKTATLCMDMLWNIYTEPNFHIVVLVPNKLHVSNIADTITSLIGDNEDLLASAKIHREPYKLTLTNGSDIKIIAVNAKPGQARGHNASAVYLDEADYLVEEVIKVVTGYIISRENVKMWASSTPSGARAWFYQICHDKKWQQFHYPSMVSPMWNKEMELTLRSVVTTQKQWELEILAEFGDAEAGVFKNEHIDKALEKSRSENGSYIDRFNGKRYAALRDYQISREIPYIVGVDWNGPKHGVQMLVAAVKSPDDVVIVDRISINTMEYTQINAVKTIIEVNERYQPERIYVDEGWGSTQVQMLHLYGEQHKESKLKDRVVPVDFSQKIMLMDPFLKVEVKKYKKDLMIDNAVRFLENGWVTLPKEEDVRLGLVDQLRNFRIIGWSAEAGKPRYSEGNDHLLDPFIMILYGVTSEKTTFYRTHKHGLTLINTYNPFRSSTNTISRDISNRETILGDIYNIGDMALLAAKHGIGNGNDIDDPDNKKNNMRSLSVNATSFGKGNRKRNIVSRRIRY